MVRDTRAVPRSAGTEIERPRLLRRLRQLTAYRVAAVIAPAGYGKSTLLRQFLAGEKRRTALVRLLSIDGDLESVVRRTCVDAAVAAPGAGGNLAAALQATYASAARGAELAQWFASHLEDDGWLIAIDDIHRCTDADAVAFLAHLVARESSNSWLLLGRGEMDFPFTVWTATGEMDAPLALDELQFSGADLAEYAAGVGVELEDETIEEILKRTGGWPMAAAFAVRSAERQAGIPAIGATRDLMFGYFARETFGTLDVESRDAVIVAAELPEVDTGLLERSGFPAARWTLSMLAQRTSFVRRDAADVYHFHDLFREFLAGQHEHVVAAERFAAVATQLDVLEQHAAALRVFRIARSHAGITDVLERHGVSLIENAQGALVGECLSVLAGSDSGTRPGILALRAMLAAYTGSAARAHGDYRRALDAAAPDQSVSIGLRYAQWLVAIGDPQRALDVLDSVSPHVSGLAQMVEADGIAATAYAIAGELQKAEPRSRESVAGARSLGEPHVLARALQRSSFVAYVAHETLAAEELAHEAIRIAAGAGNSFIAARSYSILAAIAAEADDHRRAVHYAQQIFEHAGKVGDGAAQRNALVSELTIAVEIADYERAAKLRISLQNYYATRGYRETATQRLAEATLFIATHRSLEARSVLNQLETIELRPLESALLAVLETVVAVTGDDEAAARKSHRMAHRWLSRDRESALSNDERRLGAVVRILLAPCAVWLGRESEARVLLDDPRRIDVTPATEQLARCVRAEIEHLGGTMHTALGGYLAVAKIPIDAARLRRSDSPLTRTESTVLQHLARGESDKEIAAALGLRPNTISNHVKSITTKLNCRGRYRAVVVARELGYLAAESPAG